MTITAQAEKAEAFRALHIGPPILVLPNAWDAASARIFEASGFPAVATTSAGVAYTLGYPDGQVVPRDEALFLTRRIARTVRVPVTADIEAGYGAGSVAQVLETVRGVLSAGVVGINLEDSAEGGQDLAGIGLQVEKIEAVRDLGVSEGVPLVINARTDAFHLPIDSAAQFALAVERLNAYFDAGADCLFAPFVADAATIARLVEAVPGPLNVLAVAGSPPVAELEKMGVARVSVGAGPCRAALALTRRVAEELRQQGTYNGFLEGSIPYDEVNRLFRRD